MNPSAVYPRKAWLRRAALFLLPVCAVSLLVIGVTGFVRLGRDARALRNSLIQTSESFGVGWRKKFEVRVGPISLQVARTGLSLAPLPEEVRTALRSVRGGEVGIYQLVTGSIGHGPRRWLEAADDAMRSRGWYRVVGVAQDDQFVAVYAPVKAAGGTTLQVAVAVLSQEQLVVASGRSDLAPLMELAKGRPEWKQRSRWIAAQL